MAEVGERQAQGEAIKARKAEIRGKEITVGAKNFSPVFLEFEITKDKNNISHKVAKPQSKMQNLKTRQVKNLSLQMHGT